jgi:hypothetical protein
VLHCELEFLANADRLLSLLVLFEAGYPSVVRGTAPGAGG